MRLVLILTRSPFNPMARYFIELALFAMSEGYKTGIYLVGDGVLCAKMGQHVAGDLSRLILSGGEVFISKEDLELRGLSGNCLVSDVKIQSDFFGSLVDDVMEKSQRVISF